LERAQRADSAGSAPNPFLPQGASACLDSGYLYDRAGAGASASFTFPDGWTPFHFFEDPRLCTKPQICKSSGTIRRKLIHRESFRASVFRPTLATTRCENHCTGILRLISSYQNMGIWPESQFPISPAVSMGRCNTSSKSTCRRL
jgi:hypothetical protein